MQTTLLRSAAATAATVTLAVGGLASPANAQPVIAANNLVNVQITNLLNNNEVAVQIPINAAANICGVSVVVLASDLAGGPVTCDARGGNQQLTITQ